jgi:hypothetical protein
VNAGIAGRSHENALRFAACWRARTAPLCIPCLPVFGWKTFLAQPKAARSLCQGMRRFYVGRLLPGELQNWCPP